VDGPVSFRQPIDLAFQGTAAMRLGGQQFRRLLRGSGPSRGNQFFHLLQQRAIEAVIGAGTPGYDEAMLDADLMMPFDSIRPALNQVGAQLTIQAREWYLAEVIRIAMADGTLTEGERHAALAIGVDLGMTQAQVVGVVAMTEQSAGHD